MSRERNEPLLTDECVKGLLAVLRTNQSQNGKALRRPSGLRAVFALGR